MAATSPPYKYAFALQGAIGDQPAASTVPQDTLYWATDTTTAYISDGSAWHALGGGGGIPDSWLTVEGTPLTATANFTFSQDGILGSDLAIDGGDHTVIDILTDGVYEVAAVVAAGGDATGAGTAGFQVLGTFSNDDWMAGSDIPGVTTTVIPPSYYDKRQLIAVATKASSGDTIQISASITTTAGTITAYLLSMVVRRLA